MDTPLPTPHERWALARAQPPQVIDDGSGGHLCQLTRRRDIEAVLRDSETFGSHIVQESMAPYMGPMLVGMDGDEHARYRRLVSHAFRQAALARWEDELIRPTIETLVDAIELQGAADLVATITVPYPTQVIAGIIGVPATDHEQFHEWAVAINEGPLQPDRGVVASRAMRQYLEPIVEDRRAHRRDDLVSDIVHAEIDGERLDDEHVYGFLRLLLPAGAETTYRELGIVLTALLTHDGWWQRVVDDPDLIASVIEESLRWDGSVPMIIRVADRDTEIDGCPVAAGASVLLTLGSANRDENEYTEPADWDPGRTDPTPHLAFGWGRHLCLGMHLARLEMRVALETLARRMPGLRLEPGTEAPVVVGEAFRGPERLDVVW